MAWGGTGGGLSDWRTRAGLNRPRTSTTRRTTSQQNRAAANAPPQSEGRYTSTGYNSPLHNYYVANFTNPSQGQGYTTAGYQRFARNFMAGQGQQPMGPSMPLLGGDGGGRGGYGGGGGGGGGAALSQAMFDQMIRALGTMGPQLQLQQTAMPAFQGANIPVFNAAPYTQATNELTGAFNADTAAAQGAANQATTALQSNYTNPYAGAQQNMAAAPQAAQMGAGLMGTVGGGGDQAAQATQQQGAMQSDQASFANLLKVLAAQDQASQTSRLNQVALDLNTANQGLAAQRRGLLGGINMARTQAQRQWSQQDAERRYQNSLMAQQWRREDVLNRQNIANQQAQGNWQQRNEMISGRMAPLLELLAGTAGTQLNANSLQQLLSTWGQR